MRVIRATDVTQAFVKGINVLIAEGDEAESRNGSVITMPEPVATVYYNPRRRVLVNEVRRANPYFHLMEAMWMLAGRNDIKFVAEFNKQMAAYSDDGGVTQPAAYGHRWRNHFAYDQIAWVIAELRKNPNSRRVVVSMWDADGDPQKVQRGGTDVPCNTTIFFRRRTNGTLDMTVSCRSNDIIWGCYGANVVHMSFLHEFVAAAVEMDMGTYTQVSNDLHAYTDIFDKRKLCDMAKSTENIYYGPGSIKEQDLMPLVAHDENIEIWWRDLHAFFDLYDNTKPMEQYVFKTKWFNRVVLPMFRSWAAYKSGDYQGALDLAAMVVAADWRIGCKHWLMTSKLGLRQEKTA